MTRVKQKSDGRGSLKDIQNLINKNQDIIDNKIKNYFHELANDEIKWKSPLINDDYAEYRDNNFISQIGLDNSIIKIEEFWPKKGPQWDALATTNKGNIILVEAKANIPEIVTPATGASPQSKKIIGAALNKTKEYLSISNDIDWSGKFYQYTNRLAHLYFLRIIKNKPVYLLNIYFIGDEDVEGPKTKAEWDGAIKVLHSYLGTSKHKLSKYMADIFIDISTFNK